MNAERIRAAAEWAEGIREDDLHAAQDAAHILGKLASGEWVLCKGEPVGWGMRKQDKQLVEDLVGEEKDVDYWLTDDDMKDAVKVSLHARITEEP